MKKSPQQQQSKIHFPLECYVPCSKLFGVIVFTLEKVSRPSSHKLFLRSKKPSADTRNM